MAEHYNPPSPPRLVGTTLEETQRKLQDWCARATFVATLPPARHAHTHLGGSDNLVSDADPSTVSFGAEASPGDPHAGVSAAGHVHPLDADLESLEGLTGISFEDIDEDSLALTYDPISERLYGEILLELTALHEEVLEELLD